MKANIISEQCSVVSLYGIASTKESLANFYHRIVQWFQEVGHSVDKLSVHGPGHSGRPVSFASADSKLRKLGFEGITDLDVFSLIPDARIPINDYLLTATWSATESYVYIVSRSSIASLSDSVMLPLARKIIQDVKPAYGIGYTRNHRLGPAMYAVGIAQGLGLDGYGVGLTPAEQEEANSICRWGDGIAERIWEKGVLRDVYPWNFLNQFHLAKQIGDTSLEQWIQRDEQRGNLSSFQDGITFWNVPESSLPLLRQILFRAGVIFDWKKQL